MEDDEDTLPRLRGTIEEREEIMKPKATKLSGKCIEGHDKGTTSLKYHRNI